jgi:hypothetical protein
MKRSTTIALVVGILLGTGIVLAATYDVPTSGTVYVSANDAPSVGIAGGKTINMSTFGPTGETRANISNSGILYADGPADSTVVVPSSESLDDGQIRVEQINATGAVGLETPSTQRIIVGGEIDTVTWRTPSAATLDDGVVDFSYGGSGTSIVEVGSVPANTEIRAVDANTGEVVGIAASDSSGRVNFSSLSAGTHDVLLQQPYPPSLSKGRPQQLVDEIPTELQVNVSDPDFPADDVTLTWTLDSDQVGTTTVSQNGTATIPIDGAALVGGSHSVDVTASGFGGSDTLSYTFKVPSSIYIYNESDPDQLIQSSAGIRIRAFGQGGSDTVLERTVTNGVLNLTGFDPTQRYVVTVDSENSSYNYRRIVLESIYNQSSIYLLPESQPAVSTEFTFTDYTGQFPPGDTYLFIEAPIRKDYDNDSNLETRYQTISGDTIGPTGTYPATLAQNERYRLRIRNAPNQRLLGGFTATRSEVEEIAIRGQTLEPPEGQYYAVKWSVKRGTDGQRDLTFRYLDEAANTSSLSLRVEYTSNGTAAYLDTVTDTQNYTVYDIPLANDTSYTLNWTAKRGGETIGGLRPIGGGTTGLDIPLDPDWLGSISLVSVVFVASLAGTGRHTYIALATVGFAGILMYLQTVEILVPLWWLALVVSAGGHLKEMQSPR